MLPIELIVVVVSFFGYYDLGGVQLATKLLSAVAKRCADAIRFFDLSDLVFFIYDASIEVYRLNTDGRHSSVCSLELTSEKNLAEFISDAFRNRTVGHFVLRTQHKHVQGAIKVVENTTTVNTLTIFGWCFEKMHDLLKFVDGFRCVKVRSPNRCWLLRLRLNSV